MELMLESLCSVTQCHCGLLSESHFPLFLANHHPPYLIEVVGALLLPGKMASQYFIRKPGRRCRWKSPGWPARHTSIKCLCKFSPIDTIPWASHPWGVVTLPAVVAMVATRGRAESAVFPGADVSSHRPANLVALLFGRMGRRAPPGSAMFGQGQAPEGDPVKANSSSNPDPILRATTRPATTPWRVPSSSSLSRQLRNLNTKATLPKIT